MSKPSGRILREAPCNIRAALALVFSFLAPGVVLAQVEAWTNQAGHVIHAALVEYDGSVATLRTTNGVTLKMPLSALREESQRRIRTRYGESIAPVLVQTAYRDAAAVLARYDSLPAESKSADERQRAGQIALAIFDGRIAAWGVTNLDAGLQAEINRLRDSLR